MIKSLRTVKATGPEISDISLPKNSASKEDSLKTSDSTMEPQ